MSGMSKGPSFPEAFRAEVSRLAKREARALVSPVSSELVKTKKTVVQQKRAIAKLERTVKRLTGLLKSQAAASETGSVQEVEEALAAKWRKDSVRSTRNRLKLTQTEFAALLGVSIGSVNGWETGRTEPREGRKRDVLALRSLTPAEAQERLQAAG